MNTGIRPLQSRGLRAACLVLLAACALRPVYSATASAPSRASSAASQPAPDAQDQEDRRRNEVRPYPHPLGSVRSVKIRSARFFDADNQPCASPPPRSRAITPRHVRTYLRKAFPVSQIAVMNHYGAFGECTSAPVEVTFSDGHRMRMAFAADSGVAYLAPLVNGREGDAYFYVCEDCER
ncbi:hypothetical protein SAMN04489710_101200 [Paracidovorax konjaci]|uniref:Uncharacterized protein n=1 Tax=Paracidovorax konjaci TaxID=32040 RepID=A0A1I1RKA3_9BURK|nr:hypothetical protein SAMN04489710_101200 [Paracidovorax konjaci]